MPSFLDEELDLAAVDENNGNGVVVRAVLKHVVRIHNMSALARDTGLNRGNFYDALSEEGNPTLSTLLKITCSLGLKLHFESVDNSARGAQPAKYRNLRADSTST